MPYYTPYNYQPSYMPQAYQAPVPQAQPQPVQMPSPSPSTSTGINWVNGEREAMLYPVAPNTAIALWDSTAPCIYLKQADASGKPTVKAYDLVERVQEKTQENVVQEHAEYATKQEFGSVASAIEGIRHDIDSIKSDLYGLAGKNKTKKESEE